jgi:hypothetical protein
MPQTTSIKLLALKVLQQRVVTERDSETCPRRVFEVGHSAGQSESAAREADVAARERHGARALAPCGSPYCAGCYDVGEGKRIHPPKCGHDYLEWLKKWEGKGRLQ